MRSRKTCCNVLLAVLMAFLPASLAAQTLGSSINTFSPYSFYGIGDLELSTTAASRGMGGVGLGFRSDKSMNLQNPASYSAIGRQTALFHVGMDGKATFLRSQTTDNSYLSFNVSDVAFQLPLAKGLGLAVSVLPYSSVGYRITTVEESPDVWENIGYVHYLYSGTGGVNQFKVGLGYAITDWLSVGAEMIYYQGNIRRNYSQTIETVVGDGYYLGVNSDNQEQVSRLFADFGIQARLMKQGDRSLTLGLTYTLGGKLNSKVIEQIEHGPYFTSIGYDEVVNRTYRSSFRLPHRFGGGLYYQGSRWSGGVDYRYDAWGVNGVDATTGVRYRDTHAVSAGVQLVPKAGDVRRIMNRWAYRLGVRYNQYYMAFDGHNIDEKAISLGVGIPLGARGVNAIDVGFEFGTRGVVAAGLVRENFFRVSIGLSLFGDDYWFMKYKYD